MSSYPKVSVIIPVYGVEAYIARCAKSLFEQTLDEIEYIFVNDCTPDKSIDILYQVLAEYPKRKNQVRIINQPTNLGAAKAREVGIKAATGEYVIQCDSDDWVDKDMLKVLYNRVHQDDYDMIICDWFDSDGIKSNHVNQKIRTDKKEMTSDLISRRLSSSMCNRLIKRSLFTKTTIIHPTAHMMEDVAYIIQLTYYSERIAYLPVPLYYYYSNPNSICHAQSEQACISRAYQAVENINLVLTFLNREHIINDYETEILILKNSARVFLWPLLMQHYARYIKLWKSIYPEINWHYPFKKGIPLRLRIIFFFTLIGIYPILHKFLTR